MRKLICVVGPTASGKTALAVELALRYDAEIISADSMQIYRGMDIGTAKPTAAERKGIAHHMIDILDPSEEYSAARYAADAGQCARDILERGKLPIIAGGTGFYIDALTGAQTFVHEHVNFEIRERLQAEAATVGSAAMHARLTEIDPVSAGRIHERDSKRIIRALEIYELTGKPASARKNAAAEPRYDAVKIGLGNTDREALYTRIDARVDAMFEAGLVDEAGRILVGNPGKTARQAIGYKELFRYFDGECTLGEAREDIARETRRYAKRQLTWFRRDKAIHWIAEVSGQLILERACGIIDERL